MSTTQVLLRRWRPVIAGLLLSAIACAFSYSLIPQQYVSTATVALVAPRKPGSFNSNPLLMPFAGSLGATAQGIVESLSAPDVSERLGLVDGRDTLTVKTNGQDLKTTALQPYLYVTAVSTEPARAVMIVSAVLDLAQSDLARQQVAIRVPRVDQLRLVRFVDPTSPQVQPGMREVLSGVVLLLAVGLTVALVCVADRMSARRRRRELTGRDELLRVNPAHTYHRDGANGRNGASEGASRSLSPLGAD